MRTFLQVLSENERAQVHERTLSVLAKTGIRVNTAQGRRFLKEAGAEVDENTNIVRFPRALVEEAIRCAPKSFTLGARRPDWDLQMNNGDCVLLIDGEATTVFDWKTNKRRPSTFNDWLESTRLTDALDEVGLYWCMTEGGQGNETYADLVKYWRNLFGNFSKHIQDGLSHPEQVPWLLEVMQVIFGDKKSIRQQHPLSFLLCPQSPLIIDQTYTDAYLALLGWDIPIAAMPMPLMGGTAPGSLIGTTILSNCEVLGMLCLIQAAAPGTPFICAPVPAIMDLRSGQYSAGAVEQGLLNAAATEMARYYGLPAETSGMTANPYVPGIQASYEKSINGLLPVLSWPDIMVGSGTLGGSMTYCHEQLLIDVETFKMYKQAHQGIDTSEDKWLDDAIERVGPGGHFLMEPSTMESTRNGEWFISKLGVHGTVTAWERAGKPSLLEEAHEKVSQILKNHQPFPLDKDAERELDRIEKQAREKD